MYNGAGRSFCVPSAPLMNCRQASCATHVESLSLGRQARSGTCLVTAFGNKLYAHLRAGLAYGGLL